MTKQQVIFCDFDGTITENDNIVAIMKHFDPPGWSDIVTQILDRSISIREGVGTMFRLLPSSRKEAIVHYAIHNAVIRKGFPELLEYCREHNITFYVTSGGIDFFVYPLLAPYPIDPSHIYCNGSSFAETNITIEWPHPCDEFCQVDCGMCKTTIIRRFPSTLYERILIGDSITDFEGAKLADTVFARSHLEEKCKEVKIPFVPFTSFHDVIHELQIRKGGALE
ncbi:MAG: 2,3-diketo-5-methylthio-phosphopentane phosphatase [Paenibacillus sp.]|nr:2,3-diketo-5-methylthio-phosphopentane phosphatase [Paenibacillus sp.]